MHLLPRREMQHPAGVAEAATTLAAGGLAILLDDETGVADLVMAARRVTREGIALMAVHGRGLTELALSPARVAALRLPPMVSGWDTPRKPFTVSIEAREGVSTGISARDRAHTIRVAVDDSARPEDLITPGHVFPLRARPGGRGRAEAALALSAHAGCGEGAVLCAILDDEGGLAGEPALDDLAARLSLPRVSSSEIPISRRRAWL